MVNSPLPTDLAGECRKAAKILNSFIDPIAAKGPDKVIPPNILQKAKGFAIFTVIKAGFVFSGRAGSGLVIARLEDGSWSAPSAIGTGGMGFGGQIGAEITDFVIVLNSKAAVKSFMHGGNVTLGGNLNAEGAGSVSLGHVAAVFSYSKTKGLFAGVSIEGSIIIERKDANAKLYHRKVTAKELLSGQVPPPPQADVLYRALSAKASRSSTYETTNSDLSSEHDDATSTRSAGTSQSVPRNYRHSQPPPYSAIKPKSGEDKPRNTNPFDADNSNSAKSVNRSISLSHNNSSKPPPIAPKPQIPPRAPKPQTAIALYDFTGEQEGDLGFTKGDLIIVTKKTESNNDWCGLENVKDKKE
ncbi:11370_t:CDS:10, partial [Dentiscutata heterogama]